MRLGIVLTDDAHVTVACALMQEALKRGWQIRCFLTHRGVLAYAIPISLTCRSTVQ